MPRRFELGLLSFGQGYEIELWSYFKAQPPYLPPWSYYWSYYYYYYYYYYYLITDLIIIIIIIITIMIIIIYLFFYLLIYLLKQKQEVKKSSLCFNDWFLISISFFPSDLDNLFSFKRSETTTES